MRRNLNFSPKEEGIIIRFVKSHEILYNVRHPGYRETDLRDQLWMELALKLNKDVTQIKRRWATMRDYYFRMLKKRWLSGQTVSPRVHVLSFLRNMNARTNFDVYENSVDSVEPSCVKSEPSQDTSYEDGMAEKPSINLPISSYPSVTPEPATPLTSNLPPTEVEFEHMEHMEPTRPQQPPSVMLSTPYPTNECLLDSYFACLATTMRTFPPSVQAELKLKMYTMVAEKEMELAKLKEECGMDGMDMVN